MALDELIGKQLGILQGFTIKTLTRWRDAANSARLSVFTVDDLFEVFRDQFVNNWDTWNDLMAMPIAERLPTVALRGQYNDMVGKAQGSANVNRRLTAATYGDKVALERLSGGAEILPDAYDVTAIGDFEGDVNVAMVKNVTTAPVAGIPDVYFGPLIATFPGEKPAPIAWIVVVATL